MNLYSMIQDSPSGGTYALASPHTAPETGFMVGGSGTPLVLASPSELLRSQVDNFVDMVPAAFVGWWTDADTGKFYLDGSDLFSCVHCALEAAESRGELAIYDIANDREIRA